MRRGKWLLPKDSCLLIIVPSLQSQLPKRGCVASVPGETIYVETSFQTACLLPGVRASIGCFSNRTLCGRVTLPVRFLAICASTAARLSLKFCRSRERRFQQ